MKNLIKIIVASSLVLWVNTFKLQGEGDYPGSTTEGHKHRQKETIKLYEPTDYSIYNLDDYWLTQENAQIKFDDLRGKVVVLTMFYSSCDYACPRILADMKRIESDINQDKKSRVAFVMVSIDSKRDTPQTLRTFAKESGLDSQHWYLLHGNEDGIRELAVLLGVKYKSVSTTDFAHSNIITVLNDEGEIIHQQEGLGVKHAETSAAVNRLIN